MEYKKLQGSAIFNGNEFLNGHVLVLNKDEIVDCVPAAQAGNDVEQVDGILCPGFINCHCHLELSHMKGVIPKGTGLTGFLLGVLGKREETEEKIFTTISDAEKEMLQNGIVAVGDICNTIYSIGQKQQENLYYQNFIEATGSHPSWVESRYALAMETYAAFENEFAKHNSIVPHAPYSISPALFERIKQASGNGIISMHNQEDEAENEFFKTGTGAFVRFFETLHIDYTHFKPTGTTSLQAVLPYFTHNKKTILVHNVATSEEDILQVKASENDDHAFYWCLCPNANIYISNTMPNVPDLTNNNCTIVLGTDSLASNDNLSILEEMKTIKLHFPHIDWSRLLTWATHNGAQALGIDNLYGTFKKDMKPGVLVLSPDYGSVTRLV